MILSASLLIIINWLKRNRQNTSKHKYMTSCLGNTPSQSFQSNDILLHYTNLASMVNSISLLSKSKIPVNIFQIMMAIVYAYKIF